MKRLLAFSVSFVFLFVAFVAAQQPPAPAAVAGRGAGVRRLRRRRSNWPSPPVPDGPLSIDTGLVRPIKVTITKGLNQPFGMAFLPDGGILITERGGKLRMVRNGVLNPTPVEGLAGRHSGGGPCRG